MRPAPIELERAVVAITGGGRGIGRATASLFAERGATTCIGDLDPEAAADAASSIGLSAHAFALDVADRASFEQFVADVERTFGPVDVLVNNAGIMPTGRFLEEPDTTTDAIFAVNVRGVINGLRAALPGMVEHRRGHVVNVASMFGKTEAPGVASYIASKHAVVGLGAAVRQELRDTGVTVTTVLPGIVNTELSSGIGLGVGRLLRVEPEQVAAAIVASLKGRPREVAVPAWLSLYPALRPLIPERVEVLVRKLVGDDKALSAVDPAIRAAYELRARSQAGAEP